MTKPVYIKNGAGGARCSERTLRAARPPSLDLVPEADAELAPGRTFGEGEPGGAVLDMGVAGQLDLGRSQRVLDHQASIDMDPVAAPGELAVAPHHDQADVERLAAHLQVAVDEEDAGPGEAGGDLDVSLDVGDLSEFLGVVA